MEGIFIAVVHLFFAISYFCFPYNFFFSLSTNKQKKNRFILLFMILRFLCHSLFPLNRTFMDFSFSLCTTFFHIFHSISNFRFHKKWKEQSERTKKSFPSELLFTVCKNNNFFFIICVHSFSLIMAHYKKRRIIFNMI